MSVSCANCCSATWNGGLLIEDRVWKAEDRVLLELFHAADGEEDSETVVRPDRRTVEKGGFG
jgi:hypothetical protein